MEIEWEVNTFDNTVDITFYGVTYSADVDFFNVTRTFVKNTYWNDGLQQTEYDKEINIMETDSEFTLNEILYCFTKVPAKELKITV